MEGLEVSEIYLSKLENVGTIGAEYYAPEFLRPYERLKKSAFTKRSLKSICSLITDGDHGSAEYAENGITFILSEAVKVGWIDKEACRYITTEHAATLQRSTLRSGDVLVSKTGVYFGHSAVVATEFTGANTIAHVGVLRLKPGVNPYFISMFLNSAYGYTQLRRRGIKATRPEIKLLEFADIAVPMVSDEFSQAVQDVVLKSESVRARAKKSAIQAEQLLLASLGLAGWQAPDPLSYARSSRDAFAAGRLDAEHFKPKYVELVKLMQAKGHAVGLGSLLAVNQRGKQPEYADDGLPVVNSKHVMNGDVRLDQDNRKALLLYDAVVIELGDVAMNGTGVGTIGRAAPYLHQFKSLPDNHVTILRPKKEAIDPVYLAVFLNSFAGQMQVEQRLSGSSGQIELYPKDIADFSIWLAPAAV